MRRAAETGEETSGGRARSAKKRSARRWGFNAEFLAALYLRIKFYRILARGYSIREGEIDIIAQRGDTIAFVEVKARASLEQAAAAITPAKRRRMSRAARVWIARAPIARGKILRGDALFVIKPSRLARFRVIHWPGGIELDLD